MNKYHNRLLYAFLFGNFEKYFEPINLLKNYYGEKYAFEYVYLLHYQAWLFIPGIMGLASLVFQVLVYVKTEDVSLAKDSKYNAILGLLIALWATIFVESWKRVQKRITYMWNCSDKSFDKKDEREEDFLYYNFFNYRTEKFEKLKKDIRFYKDCGYKFGSALGLAACILSMTLFRMATKHLKYEEDGTPKKLGTAE